MMTITSSAVNAPRKVTRSSWGYDISYETLAIDENGDVVKVEYGQASTYFTAPAKTIPHRGKAIYGFITGDWSLDNHDQEGALRFIEANDQADAKQSFRESVRR
jgi:hypothetical protein